MSNNTETNNHDREIDVLKSTINKLTQENKQLLESNKQLKLEYSKFRDYITNIVASELETQIQNITRWSKILLEYHKSPQKFPGFLEREGVTLLTMLTRNAALRLHMQVEDMKRDRFKRHL
jgi:hypothetical protein